MTGHIRKSYAKAKSSGDTDHPQSEVETADVISARPQVTPLDTSSYILSMVTELRALAKASNFRFLTYLLEMVFQEAFRMTSELELQMAQKRKPFEPEPKT
jgi:hypothetical protein